MRNNLTFTLQWRVKVKNIVILFQYTFHKVINLPYLDFFQNYGNQDNPTGRAFYYTTSTRRKVAYSLLC